MFQSTDIHFRNGSAYEHYSNGYIYLFLLSVLGFSDRVRFSVAFFFSF